MNTYRLGLYEKSMPGFLSLPQKLGQTKAAGFDYMELSVDETAESWQGWNGMPVSAEN